MVRPLSLWAGKPLWSGHRLVRLRGRGGFGQVWEAQTPDKRHIALKFIHCVDRFAAAEEVRNIMRIRELSHVNLVFIEKVWADSGYVGVTMELADGSLNDLLQLSCDEFSTPLAAKVACDYLRQAAVALDFLNAPQHMIAGRRVSIQHGDVKPGNLLAFGDKVKLCDFGLNGVVEGDMGIYRRAGTAAYAAPEIFRGQLSRWTDQHALAVTYHELRTGELPFAKSPTRFVDMRPEPDLTLLPSPERQVIARALATRPHDRWASCGEMVAELTRAISGPSGA